MFIFEIILALVVFIPLALLLIDYVFKTSYSCKIMGWHNGKGEGVTTFDGCSIKSTCSKCGAKVMQDSQGNWF